MVHVTQNKDQVRKYGTNKASWYVVWQTPEGRTKKKSCRIGGKAGRRLAEKLKIKIQSELLLGTYRERRNWKWTQFRKEYERLELSGLGKSNAEQARYTMAHFERHCNPKNVAFIDTRMLDEFVAKRRQDHGGKPGSTLSLSTVKKDLTYIRKMLRKALDWDVIEKVPSIPRIRPMEHIEEFISPEEFTRLYDNCDVATRPVTPNLETEIWWKCFLSILFMTGWRLNEVLNIRWENVDFEEGTVFSPAEVEKGRRDQIIPLHPVVAEHLKKMQSFEEKVFPNRREDGVEASRKRLYKQFHRIQKAAGVHKMHGDGFYGFHAFRCGFATANAENMDVFILQKLMKHRCLVTTQRYAAMAHRLKKPIERLVVPEALRRNG